MKPAPVGASPAFGMDPDLILNPDAALQPFEGGGAIPPLSGNCFCLYIAMMTLASWRSRCHTVDVVSFS